MSCVVCAGPPTASPFGHRCTVGVNRDPPVCHDVQGDIVTERQPVGCCVGLVLLCWLLCSARGTLTSFVTPEAAKKKNQKKFEKNNSKKKNQKIKITKIKKNKKIRKIQKFNN